VVSPSIAVVGSGPAGVFVVESILKSHPDARVDVIERLPAPYGLLRYGVAPDHLKIKSLATGFARTLGNARVRFFGNVELGRDVDVDDLHASYDAIVYAIGAPSHRALGIPGEELPGSLPAGEFVAWYGGHPEKQTPPIDLSAARAAAVIGVGNVAIDTARILLKDTALLTVTDMSRETLAILAESGVRDVSILGRRGPQDAKFTTKELRELGELPGVDVVVEPRDLEGLEDVHMDGQTQRNVEVLREFSQRPPTGAPRRLFLRFFARPVAITGADAVASLQIERMAYDASGTLHGTGVIEELPVELVFRAVGYRSIPLPGIPFDERNGLVPNVAGRVLDAPGGPVRAGEYVSGWVKRGPQGVIGTNKQCASETVAAIFADFGEGTEFPERPDLVDLLRARSVPFIDWDGWTRIDARERELGAAEGRERVKISALEALLAASR
jgi:ferredoxin--NADP+ reductase